MKTIGHFSTPAQGKNQNRLDYLLSRITEVDLRSGLQREISKLRMNRKFGLVFEEHIQEHVRLYHLPIIVGSKVVKREGKGDDVFNVLNIEKGLAQLSHEIDGHWEDITENELVVVKKFGEPIYPSLVHVDRVTRSENKPYHTIINAENHHALELLSYCYEGKIDVIYIDPPYNTGARDWKYNNNYVDSNDEYRHSKWLSMMKKRLILSRKLLSKDGVLIVTIDDNEACELGLLIDQLFPEKNRSAVVIRCNPKGVTKNGFSRSHEYAYFLMREGQDIEKKPAPRDIREINLRRSGNNSNRADSPSMFYPIHIRKTDLKIIGAGETPPVNFHPKSQTIVKKDFYEIWPIDDKGNEKNWYYGLRRVREKYTEELFCKKKKDRVHVYFRSDNEGESKYPSMWSGSEFDAGAYGSTLVKNIIGREFPFPKSLYAVSDCLNAIVKNKKEALILDFFAGSGTTLHATCLLNAQDDGRRQCILITNNEVDESTAKELSNNGIHIGDPRFEKYGICEAVTWPRCKFAVTGKRDDGTDLTGEYLNDRPLKQGFEENIEYFRLEYLNPDDVAYREKLQDILPILWLIAKGRGELENPKKLAQWYISKNSPFAVLMDETAFSEFKKEIMNHKPLTHIFIVTDSEEAYRDMCLGLPKGLKTKMLYKSYLENFRINTTQNL